MAQKKSWTEKLNDSKDLPKIVKLKGDAVRQWKGGVMAIPAPIEVDGIMKKVPKGKLITINEIREAIAKKHKAEIGCPLTCGIFAWIAANAAEEERAAGKKNVTPWWRTLKTGGELNLKYPGAPFQQKSMLESEGHKVIQKGKRYLVENYQDKLINA